MVACGEEPHPGTPPSLDWWWSGGMVGGGWYMCSHVESNVASFSPGFSKHCVRYCNRLNCGATFRFLLNNSNHKLEVLSFHVVFTVKLYTLFGLPPYHSHPSHSARGSQGIGQETRQHVE